MFKIFLIVLSFYVNSSAVDFSFFVYILDT